MRRLIFKLDSPEDKDVSIEFTNFFVSLILPVVS